MKRWLAVPLAVLALFIAIRETREPYVWLFADDLLNPKPAPIDLPLDDGLALRLYVDTRPHVGKIARLQKGLVLLVDGEEWVEEGFGLGLPLVEVEGQAYLSRTATVRRDGDILSKTYVMDTIDTPSGFLRQKYVPVEPIGTVTVHYRLANRAVEVSADFGGLRRPWTRAYLMNEQGAGYFDRYEDPDGAVAGDDLGRWERTVQSTGRVSGRSHPVSFRVETDEPTSRYYGRERYYQYYWIGLYWLSWAGVDLEVEPPTERFAYRVVLDREARP